MDLDTDVPEEFIQNIRYRLTQVKLSISDEVEQAFRKVPRVNFVPVNYHKHAYTDRPLPIASGQTISAPHMYAMMLSMEAGDPKAGLNILEVGAGSGYGAALLGWIVNPGEVYSIERHAKLVEFASKNIAQSKVSNVKVIHGNATTEIPDVNFDRIIVTAAAKRLPTIYYDHLKIGGKLVIPLENERKEQWIWVLSKKQDGSISERKLMQVMFVPLVF